jgi:hypothetical protein
MLQGLTPGKAVGLSLLAFIVVVIVVVLLWHTLGAWLGVIILVAAVLVITYPIVWALRNNNK